MRIPGGQRHDDPPVEQLVVHDVAGAGAFVGPRFELVLVERSRRFEDDVLDLHRIDSSSLHRHRHGWTRMEHRTCRIAVAVNP
jgi:hypothetical protein